MNFMNQGPPETFRPPQGPEGRAAWPPPSLAPNTLEEALRLLGEAHVHRIELEKQNGELRQAAAIAVVAAISDITERRHTEDTIRKISAAVEHSPVSIVITDTNGLIEYVNPFFLETTGYSLPEVLGQNPRFLKSRSISSNDYKCLWQTLLSGDVWRGEFCNQKKNGEIFWERASISPIKNAHGDIINFVAVKEDITEHKGAEEENSKLRDKLHQAEKMESLGILVAGVAHNINNVLAIIMGTASLREEQAVEPADLKAYKTIGTVCKRGREVVKSLMQFARPTFSNRIPIELHGLIKEVRTHLENTLSNRIKIVEEFVKEPLWINGNHTEISDALMNICINALDALPNEGIVLLRTSVSENNWVGLSVTDDGEGMPPEILAHVMEPFFTTKDANKGTGLGLSMTYGVITGHGGTINITSQPGNGTTVKIKFPRIPAQIQRKPLNSPVPCVEFLNVFLVDDDADVRDLMGRVLRKAGVRQVRTFSGGQEVLASLPSGELPDLIILDQNMPGMNGTQTFMRIRNLYPELPILISSGQPDIDEWDCYKLPKMGVISKPFSVEEIQAKLNEFAQKHILDH